jgi:hypothetical protein
MKEFLKFNIAINITIKKNQKLCKIMIMSVK